MASKVALAFSFENEKAVVPLVFAHYLYVCVIGSTFHALWRFSPSPLAEPQTDSGLCPVDSPAHPSPDQMLFPTSGKPPEREHIFQ